jgi:hypothetical protein
VERVVDRWADEGDTFAIVSVTGTVTPLPSTAEVTLLRSVQEGLANVRRHATASQVSVTLSCMHHLVAQAVQDDGTGCDPGGSLGSAPEADGTGLGLTAMRERVDQLGGSVSVESAPGEGTTVAVAIPLLAGQLAAQTLSGGWDGRGNLMEPIRLLIAHDHPVVRTGLLGMMGEQPDSDVVGGASTGGEAVSLVADLGPGLVLMDLRRPERDG